MLRGQQQGLAPGLRGMDLLGSRPKGKGTLAAAHCGGSYASQTFLMFFGRSWGRWKLFVHSSGVGASHHQWILALAGVFSKLLADTAHSLGIVGSPTERRPLGRWYQHQGWP